MGHCPASRGAPSSAAPVNRDAASSSGLPQSAVAALAVGAAAVAFYAPALLRAHGNWPVPLDDTYIYFDFARSAALGHAFEWLPGNGYSSGSTSLVYPL